MPIEAMIGIDVGTTSCKAAIVARDGRELAVGRVPTPWHTRGSETEADPRSLAAAARRAVAAAMRDTPSVRIAAVGIAGVAETGVLVDRRARPVGPAIAWHDPRGDEEAAELRGAFEGSAFAERTGLPASALCSLAKYRWLRRHIPGASNGRRWFSVPEWLVRELGGEEVAELSLASRTGFLDVRRGTWSTEILDWAGAPSGLLPPLAPAGTPAGRVRDGLSGATGAVLTVAGHDHLCAAVGAGAIREGDVVNSWGTAEALIAARKNVPQPTELVAAVAAGLTIGRHVLPERYAVVAGFPSGFALGRFLELLGVDHEQRLALDEAAAALAEEPSLLVETPSAAEATIRRIGPHPCPADVWRAVLDAVSREGAAYLEKVERFAGPHKRLVLTGGWARSHALASIRERIIGPLVLPEVEEATARGAALIAGYAASFFPSLVAAPEPLRFRSPDAPVRAQW